MTDSPMTLTWHLVKKDLWRLRLPVALFSLLSIGKLAFYAWVGGLAGATDQAWLQALQHGPEFLLRTYAEPLMAYFLTGWLVFEDSPVEQDAHWITRPVSGWQMFTAKLAAAGLLFVLWPLAINVGWWWGAGLGWTEMGAPAIEFAASYAILVVFGLACAALTDGFPRFILWSLVGLGGCAMLPMIFAVGDRGAFGLGVSRQLIWGSSGAVVALALAAHQFVTRRRRKSLGLALAGVLLVGALGGLWPWDLLKVSAPRPEQESEETAGVRLTVARPVHYQVSGRGRAQRHHARVTLQITGVPDAGAVTLVTATGEWSFKNTKVWTSKGELASDAQIRGAVRRILGFKSAGPEDDRVDIALPISPRVVQRTAQEPGAFHADVALRLLQGEVVAEIPLREVAAPAGGRAYSISGLGTETLMENRDAAAAVSSEPAVQNGISFLLTERRVAGLLPDYLQSRRWVGLPPGPTGSDRVHIVVNRRTGKFALCDWRRSRVAAAAMLNQVGVICWQLVFPVGAAPVRLEDYSLVAIRFGRGETIRRQLDVEVMSFAENPPPAAP